MQVTKARISNDKIAAVTGHKNEQSLRDYASTDLDDHRKLSKILSATPVSARIPLTELDHNHESSSDIMSGLCSSGRKTVQMWKANCEEPSVQMWKANCDRRTISADVEGKL